MLVVFGVVVVVGVVVAQFFVVALLLFFVVQLFVVAVGAAIFSFPPTTQGGMETPLPPQLSMSLIVREE